MEIEEIKQKLRSAREFTPHKIGYYSQLLEEAEYNLELEFKAIEAENRHKARNKKNFYKDQDANKDFQR